MLIAATGLCLSYVAMFFNPARAWFMTVFSLSFVPFVLLNFFLLLWALFVTHEHFSTHRWIGFGIIGVAVAIYVADLVRMARSA